MTHNEESAAGDAGPIPGMPPALAALLGSCDAIGAWPRGVAVRDRSTGTWQALAGPSDAGPDRTDEEWRLGTIEARGLSARVILDGPAWRLPGGLFRRLFAAVPPLDAVWRWSCAGTSWRLADDGSWAAAGDGDGAAEPGLPPGWSLPPWMASLDRPLFAPGRLAAEIYPDMEREWFTSPDWDPELYAAAARAGMISISWRPGPGAWLLAQLQTEYAVLDWPARHLPRRLASQAGRPDPRLAGVRLAVTDRLGPVADGIRRRFGADCWLVPAYAALIQDLAAHPREGCRPLGIELRGADGRIVAGELGYVIGRVYTCLSGFVAPDAPPGVSWGTVQILALSELLCRQGFAFMNMGHTEPPYKLALGARVLGRRDFLERWLAARDQDGAELPMSETAVIGLLAGLRAGGRSGS